MAVYICIHIFKGHGFTEAKIPTIVASDVCCFCRVQRFVAGLPFVAKSLHEPQLLFFSNATSHIANVVRYYISTYLSFHRSVHIYIYIYMHT